MSIRPFRNSDSTVCVSIHDSAFDHAAFELFDAEKIEKTAKAMAQNPASFRDAYPKKDGEEWTVFEIGVVPVETLVRINDECRPVKNPKTGKFLLSEEFCFRYFLNGVRDIKPWHEVLPKRKVGNVEYVDQEYLKKTFVRGLMRVALNIGETIYRWNNLMEDETKN